MGVFRTTEADEAKGKSAIEAFLRDGGLVIASSDRAARALLSGFHRARQGEGLNAWPTPQILNWNSLLRTAWLERCADSRLLLNPVQEQALWTEIISNQRQFSTLLPGPRQRLAQLAMEAHELLSAYAPQQIESGARNHWQQDAAAFSGWLDEFDQACGQGQLLSPNRLAMELIPLLLDEASPRPPLLLVGFDRILPAQAAFFKAWGECEQISPGKPAATIQFHSAADFAEELTACARWCGLKLNRNPQARLLIVTQQAGSRRGEIERAFDRHTLLTGIRSKDLFEFSLGIPLSQIDLAKGAQKLLRWLTGQSISEQELDWLLSTPQAAGNAEESAALAASLRALRSRGLERPEWSLDRFTQAVASLSEGQPLTAWIERIRQTSLELQAADRRPRAPLEWAEALPQLLESIGWPGHPSLSSAEFQAVRRWSLALESAASLGFDGRRLRAPEFLDALDRILSQTLFATESSEPPILIAGPAESAGLTADAIWFLGVDEDSWPTAGPMHPLLPADLQRQTGMPHASAQLDAELAESITRRLVGASEEIHFSFSRLNQDAEARPSRLALDWAGPAQPLPQELIAQVNPPPLAIPFPDLSRVSFPGGQARGGSSVLTAQSVCPFKAFSTSRLAARDWRPAEAGLTAMVRGQLLHSVLHAIWAGQPDGIRSLGDLLALGDRRSFVAGHVDRVLAAELCPDLRERMPRRYLELEAERLTRLVTDWLDYETTRMDFEVAGTEVDETITLAGLTLRLRLDRVDRLADDTLLVIDYKTGNVSPRDWDLPRPKDVQLPLYAGFALQEMGNVSGLAFAKIRAGESTFAGRVGQAKETLIPTLGNVSPLVKNALSVEDLLEWREHIQKLASEFVAGHAAVDPRDSSKTCKDCGLQSLCRIQEQTLAQSDEAAEEEGDYD
jgi:probable DNA repair protein